MDVKSPISNSCNLTKGTLRNQDENGIVTGEIQQVRPDISKLIALHHKIILNLGIKIGFIAVLPLYPGLQKFHFEVEKTA